MEPKTIDMGGYTLHIGCLGDTQQEIEKKELKFDYEFDSFEKCEKVIEEVCELYPDFRVIKGMPKSVFADKYGYDMQDEIAQCMSDFYAGKKGEQEVTDFFQKCCTSMRIYRTKNRQTSGRNPVDNAQIASQVYEIFAKENQRAACRANNAKGAALNQAYGGRSDDWVYYNADYYYQCIDRKEMLKDALQSMTAQWELAPIDTDEIEANSKMTVDGGFDFNSGWNFTYRNLRGMAVMENEASVPQRGAQFFYKDSMSDGESYLKVSAANREYGVKVPFPYIVDGVQMPSFSVDDVFLRYLQDSSARDFFHNFTIYTHNKGAYYQA